MSEGDEWTLELSVGTSPWPDGVRMRRSDETRYYVPERYPHEWELGAAYARYADENAKLREYLKMAVRVIDAAVSRGYHAHPDETERMHETMRGLGIEVDE